MPYTYSGYGSVAVGSSKTALGLQATAAIRPAICRIFTSCATVNDLATLFKLRRMTAFGTEGSGFTPFPLDARSPAATADYGVGAYSVEPTITASTELLGASINQRHTFQFQAYPGQEIVATAGAATGLAWESISSGGTDAYQHTIWHIE